MEREGETNREVEEEGDKENKKATDGKRDKKKAKEGESHLDTRIRKIVKTKTIPCVFSFRLLLQPLYSSHHLS